MNSPVVMVNRLIKILDIFMVRFKFYRKNMFNIFFFLGSSYVASPDGSRTPVSFLAFSFRTKAPNSVSFCLGSVKNS